MIDLRFPIKVKDMAAIVNAPENQNKYWNFEIYTSDPVTGTTGWEIENVSVKAETKAEAREQLKKYPNFDCIILFNFEHKENEVADFLETECYPTFKITKRMTI